jgi:predicted GNAT family N-acyltransferase
VTIAVERVRDASELEEVFAIRREVFVVEQAVPEEEEYDEHEAESHHYLARVNGLPAATARWRFTEHGVKLERFAVLAQYRKAGVGSAVLRRVLSDLPADAEFVYLHAQVPAMNLYARQGFEPVGELFYECEIPHYKMVKLA